MNAPPFNQRIRWVGGLVAALLGWLPVILYWQFPEPPPRAAAPAETVIQDRQVPGATQDHPPASEASPARPAPAALPDLPFRDSPASEQWAAVISGFVVKPVYTLLSLVLIIVLWRQTAPDLAALRWALAAFFIGENFCAANYLAYCDQSTGFEYLHSFGMVGCMGLTVFAFFEGLDRRLIKLSDPEAGCAALSLCHRCHKYAPAPCGLRRLFLLFIPVLALLALMPLTAATHAVAYRTRILGADYLYSHPVVYQLFEIRYCPVAAMGLFAVSFLLLRFKREEPVAWSKAFFAGGFGFLGFGFFRLVLFHAYRDNLVWFGFWEELTELMFIASVAAVLWIFRAGLFTRKPVPAAE